MPPYYPLPITGGQPSRGRQPVNFNAIEASDRKKHPNAWNTPDYQAPAPAVRPLPPVRQQQATAHQYPNSTGQAGITGDFAHQIPSSCLPPGRNSRSPAGNLNPTPPRAPEPLRQAAGVVDRPPPLTPGNPMVNAGRGPSQTGRNPSRGESRGGAAVRRGQSGGQPQSGGQSRGGDAVSRGPAGGQPQPRG